jgi:Spy/CpxP family protein refolding chaperone
VRAVEAKESNNTKGNNMKRSAIILALALGVSAWSLIAQEQGGPPPSGERPPPPEAGAQGGPGRGPGGFHLLPPRAQEQLNLTDDQKKQVAALEAEVKAKLEKILTPEQLKQLKEMRPPQRPGGPGGFGGRGGPDGQSGPGGEGRPQSPAQEQ